MLVLFVAFAAVMAVVGFSKWYVPAEKVKWTDNFAAAQQAAREQNKPVLLYFTAEWCGPCQSMRREVFSSSAVADAVAGVVPVRIDIDHNAALAGQFHVTAIPRFVLLDQDGQVIRSQEGALEADDFIRWVKGS